MMHKNIAGFLPPEEFEDALVFLIERGIIAPKQTHIELYNWGEPFLHPHFEAMLKIVFKKGFSFGLSTNASTLKTILVDTISKLATVRFSMPGFSQKSYDRMHGFKFDVICENIKVITSQVRAVSPDANIGIIFHLYKFNLSEVVEAKDFCKKIGLNFFPTYAFPNGFSMAKSFFACEIPQVIAKSIEDELIVDQLEIIRQKRPYDYVCPQSSILVMDEFCNVLQCCGSDRAVSGHIIGKLREVDFDHLQELRKNTAVCSLCAKLKIDYMWHNASYGN